MIPAHNYLLAKRVAIIRGDLREKYNLPEIKTKDDYIKYLETIAENEKELLAYNASSMQVDELVFVNYLNANEYEFVGGIDLKLGIFYDVTEPSPDVFLKLEDPKYLEHLKLMKRLNDKGVWSKNVLANSTSSADSFPNGKSAAHMHNIYSISSSYNKILEKNPEYKPEVYDVSPGKKIITAAFTTDGAAIGATSKNVERSLMFLDKMKYDRDYYDLTWYGVKGKHWEPVGDDKYIILPEGIEKFPPYNSAICCAGPLARLAEDTPDFRINILNQWLDNDLVTPDLVGFTFSDEKVKTEIAALTNVYSTYLQPLEFGIIDDVEQGLANVKEKFKQAGIEKVIAEVEAQIAEFRKK
jgi:putative aldouronate transport system substrate-binding protein